MKEVKLNIKTSEVEYDVQNRTYIAGRFVQANPETEAMGAEMMTDDEKSDYVRRCLQNAFSDFTGYAAEWVKSISVPDLTNELMDDGTVTITMEMPDQWPATAAQSLNELVHRYLEEDTLQIWYSDTDTTKHDARQKAAETTMGKIISVINKREQFTRTTTADEDEE